ncbi:unnamed protein product [Closterium sp. Naga37s-1]|nr:unnamed protein product [Closterium sp. Naga37s-1]
MTLLSGRRPLPRALPERGRAAAGLGTGFAAPRGGFAAPAVAVSASATLPALPSFTKWSAEFVSSPRCLVTISSPPPPPLSLPSSPPPLPSAPLPSLLPFFPPLAAPPFPSLPPSPSLAFPAALLSPHLPSIPSSSHSPLASPTTTAEPAHIPARLSCSTHPMPPPFLPPSPHLPPPPFLPPTIAIGPSSPHRLTCLSFGVCLSFPHLTPMLSHVARFTQTRPSPLALPRAPAHPPSSPPLSLLAHDFPTSPSPAFPHLSACPTSALLLRPLFRLLPRLASAKLKPHAPASPFFPPLPAPPLPAPPPLPPLHSRPSLLPPSALPLPLARKYPRTFAEAAIEARAQREWRRWRGIDPGFHRLFALPLLRPVLLVATCSLRRCRGWKPRLCARRVYPIPKMGGSEK